MVSLSANVPTEVLFPSHIFMKNLKIIILYIVPNRSIHLKFRTHIMHKWFVPKWVNSYLSKRDILWAQILVNFFNKKILILFRFN